MLNLLFRTGFVVTGFLSILLVSAMVEGGLGVLPGVVFGGLACAATYVLFKASVGQKAKPGPRQPAIRAEQPTVLGQKAA